MTSRRNMTPAQLKAFRAAKLADRSKHMSSPIVGPPGMMIDPGRREMEMRAMAAKFVMEIASSVYVRILSDKLGDPFRGPDSEVNNPEFLANIAREAFIAGRIFLQVANEPVEPEQQKKEQAAAGPKDPNQSPLVQP